MKTLIIGGNGQLGTELRKLLDRKRISYISLSSKDMDITNENEVDNIISSFEPEIIYHCAAYTNVDGAEDYGKNSNHLVNVIGTKNVSIAAEKVGAILVYISTDYVFDGNKKEEYEVDDITNPKSEYGRAKLEGEKIVKDIVSNYYIIRTSWIFGEFGNNFFKVMLKLAETKDEINVVSNQFGRPTWTLTLVEFMLFLIYNNCNYGTYQLSNTGSCSWYEFAEEILKHEDIKVKKIESKNYPQKAFRPKNSIMSLDKAKKTNFYIPHWKTAVKTLIEEMDNKTLR